MDKRETNPYASDEELEKDAFNFRQDWIFDYRTFSATHKTGLKLACGQEADGKTYIVSNNENKALWLKKMFNEEHLPPYKAKAYMKKLVDQFSFLIEEKEKHMSIMQTFAPYAAASLAKNKYHS